MLDETPQLRLRKERLAGAIFEKRLRVERALQSDLGSPNELGGLIHFVRYFWHVLEPGADFIEGWPLHAICLHLEAVTRGEIKRLLINVFPGAMKSLLVNVYWPAWEWSVGYGTMRYVTFSYAAYLTHRDNGRFSSVLNSPEYRELWGQEITLTEDGKVRVSNNHMGWKFASSESGVGTGERGTRILADDLHNVREGESEAIRTGTVQWVREGMSNRLNDMENGVIVGIGQRVHEDDASRAMLDDGDYIHLCIPMEYDSTRPCSTPIGWEDPRTYDGELAWEARFPAHVVAKLKRTLGPYAYSAQYQQAPTPRGGGILKDEWWQMYVVPDSGVYDFQPLFVVGSLDTAFKEKQESDYHALTIWAVYDDNKTKQRRIILVDAWKKRLPLHGVTVDRHEGEDERTYMRRAQPKWGLTEWVNFTCSKRRINRLLVEDSARGNDVNNELRRLYATRDWGVRLVPAKGDKVLRANAVVDLFADDMIYAPGQWVCPKHEKAGCKDKECEGADRVWRWRTWAEEVIIDCSVFPKGTHDDIVDSTTMALKHLREIGMAVRKDETKYEDEERMRHKPQRTPIYPA